MAARGTKVSIEGAGKVLEVRVANCDITMVRK